MESRVVYLNHAGTSWPKPKVVSKAVRETMSSTPETWAHVFEEAHREIAAFFGISRLDQLLFTPGCTSALSVGVNDALLNRGHRVLTSQWEHHALHRPLLRLAANGTRVEYIPPERSSQTESQTHASPLDLEWLERELARQDVGLVAITAACNVTGELLPYEDVIRLAHRNGSMVLLDAAQIVGWQALDLPSLGADIVAFGGHKGLQGPWGIGGLYLSERARMECTSARCELTPDGSLENRASRPGYCDVGSVDQVALAGLHAAIRILGQQDLASLLADARSQINRIRASLEQFDRIQFFGPVDPSKRMPTLAFSVSGFSSNEIVTHLKRNGLIVAGGVQCSPLAHQTLGTLESGLVRVSAGLGQAEDDIDDAICRMESALNEKSLQRAAETDSFRMRSSSAEFPDRSDTL